METFGNRLNHTLKESKVLLFHQSEMAQLTYASFQQNIGWINSLQEGTTIPISYPLGYRADNTPIICEPRNYSKQELVSRYNHLSLNKLPIDSIFQLVTIVETLLSDIIKLILIEYPSKIPAKKQINISSVLSLTSLEEIKICIVDNLLNEIAYKSPKDYTVEFEKYTGVNLLEHPAFHKYIELKATRDIHIHNAGKANDTYTTKAGGLARVKNGNYLPVDIQYFLISYEQCLQLNEVLEVELDKIWPSEEYRNRKIISLDSEKEQALEKLIEETTLDDKETVESSER